MEPFFLGREFSRAELILFFRMMQRLLASGLSVQEAFKVVASNGGSARLRGGAQEMAARIFAGHPLRDVFFEASVQRWPRLVSVMLVAAVDADSLERAFAGLADAFELENKQRMELWRALLVPLVTGVCALGVLCAAFYFFLHYTGWELLSCFPSVYWWSLLLVAGFLAWLFYGERFKWVLDVVLFYMPLSGALVSRGFNILFFRLLSLSLQAGVPLATALEDIAVLIDRPVWQRSLNEALSCLRQGGSLGEAFGLMPAVCMPPAFIPSFAVVADGEQCVATLDNCAEILRLEKAYYANTYATLLQPLLMIVIGIAVMSGLYFLYQQLSGSLFVGMPFA